MPATTRRRCRWRRWIHARQRWIRARRRRIHAPLVEPPARWDGVGGGAPSATSSSLRSPSATAPHAPLAMATASCRAEGEREEGVGDGRKRRRQLGRERREAAAVAGEGEKGGAAAVERMRAGSDAKGKLNFPRRLGGDVHGGDQPSLTSSSALPPERLPAKPRGRKDGSGGAPRTSRLRRPGEPPEEVAAAASSSRSGGAPGGGGWRRGRSTPALDGAGTGGRQRWHRGGSLAASALASISGGTVVTVTTGGYGGADRRLAPPWLVATAWLVAGLRRPGWIWPSMAGSVASTPDSQGSLSAGRLRVAAMCGCGVGGVAAMCACGVSGTTACAGVKQEWGLMSVVVTSSLSSECFSLFSVPPFFGRTLFWSWGTLGEGGGSGLL
uniref:Uncharacterized protein n=1 Tax=Oryza nivara TaxID=4536 RepID=A0A0E0H7V2_ORYNI